MATAQVQAFAPVSLDVGRRLLAWLCGPAQQEVADVRGVPIGVTTWVRQPRGRVVSCQRGTLWLTFDGESRDIVLEAGESHRCTTDAPLAIYGLSPSWVLVS